MDDERFCTRCGENVSNIPPEGMPASPAVPAVPVQNNDPYGANAGYNNQNPQYGTPYNQPYTYAQPAPVQNKDEMTLGKWVLTIIVTTFFGLISLIFLFVWGFGDGPESRKNYCKAMLIVELISIGVGIVCMILFFGVLAGSMSEYLNESREWLEEYGQYAAVQLSALLG